MDERVRVIQDPARLEALLRTALLDTPPEESFDRLTGLAAKLLGVPVTFLSLVDQDRDFYKSCYGFAEPISTERQMTGTTFCHYAIVSDGPLVIEDAREHAEFRDVHTVVSLGIVAYAGIPLVQADGHAIGSFCAVDFKPRQWSATDIEILEQLAASALREIALREFARAADRASSRSQQIAAMLDGLTRASLLINSAGSVDEMLSVIADQARKLIDTHRAVISLTSMEGLARPLYAASISDEIVASGSNPSLSDSLADPVLGELRGPVRMTRDQIQAERQAAQDGGLVHLPPGMGWLAVPLLAKDGRNIGTLQVDDKRDDDFNADDESLLVQFAQLAATSIENMRLCEDAQTATKAKDEFLATVSHELRTPMTSILGWTRLLRLGDLDEETQEAAIDAIERSTTAQSKLIEDLLDVSRIAAGKLRLEPQRVLLTPLLTAAIEMIRPAAREKMIELDLSIADDSCMLFCDPSRLQQVFLNLLANAVKFTPETGKIRMQCRCEGDDVVISIEDTGAGIAPEALPFVFERFRQGGQSSARAGLGLGLAIVKHLVESQGGQVAASSEGAGQGSTFTVRMPLQRGAEAGETVFLERDESERYNNLPSLEGIRVLFIDDHAETRQVVAAVLERCGATVVNASQGQQGLEILQRWKPDVLVSDIDLPFEDGCALMKKIRKLPQYSLRPVAAMALTVMAGPDDRERILAAGFDEYKVKPIEPADLAHAIFRLVPRSS